MSISISTAAKTQGQGFEIDGIKMEYRTPGAGIMLDMSKAQRRLSELQSKSETDTTTTEDLQEQEELYELVFEFYNSILKDSTEDNSSVKKWLRETPMEGIVYAIEQIQDSLKSKDNGNKEKSA